MATQYKSLPKLVTIKDKANYLGISYPTAKKMENEGYLDEEIFFKIRAEAYNDAFKVNPDVAEQLQHGMENLFVKVLAYSNGIELDKMTQKEALNFTVKVLDLLVRVNNGDK